MIRSSSVLFLVASILVGCSTMDPLTSNPFDTGNDREADGVDDGTDGVDTGDSGDTITDQASGFDVEWNVTELVVNVDDVTLPRLVASTTDVDSNYTVTGMTIVVSDMTAQTWITEIADQRLAVGTTTQSLGVFDVTDAVCGVADDHTLCSAVWELDLSDDNLRVIETSSLDFGFTMAFFDNAEMVTAVPALNDTTPDVIQMAAIVDWTGMYEVSGETIATGTFVITNTPD